MCPGTVPAYLPYSPHLIGTPYLSSITSYTLACLSTKAGCLGSVAYVQRITAETGSGGSRLWAATYRSLFVTEAPSGVGRRVSTNSCLCPLPLRLASPCRFHASSPPLVSLSLCLPYPSSFLFFLLFYELTWFVQPHIRRERYVRTPYRYTHTPACVFFLLANARLANA